MLTIALCICCLGIGACIGFVVAGICWGASDPNKMDEGDDAHLYETPTEREVTTAHQSVPLRPISRLSGGDHDRIFCRTHRRLLAVGIPA